MYSNSVKIDINKGRLDTEHYVLRGICESDGHHQGCCVHEDLQQKEPLYLENTSGVGLRA